MADYRNLIIPRSYNDYVGKAELKSELKTALDAKQDRLTFDTSPRLNSSNPVTSNGIKEGMNELYTIIGRVDGLSSKAKFSLSGTTLTIVN